jgi:hypothetical protein
MQKFHDLVLHPPDDKKQIEKMEATYTTDDPFNSDIILKQLREVDKRIHPIFMDLISRDLLNVKCLYPVKIRRSFWWEVKKKLNSFGSVAVVALSVVIAFLDNDPFSWFLWSWIILLVGLVVWSVLTSSEFKTVK